MTSSNKTFKGNKQNLPRKICVVCAREMVWRHAWRNNWDAVKYCSNACRRKASHRSVDDTGSGHP